jgi:hypothetical protein
LSAYLLSSNEEVKMKIRGGLLVLMGALACWSIGSNQARASQVIYDSVGFMQGSQTLTDSFTLASAGTLTVSLANIGWPQPLSGLTLLLTSASGGLLGQETLSGNLPFSVDTQNFNVSAGNITAQWFGTPQSGGFNTGVYGLEIQFQPGSSPVPLPTSIALLLSGLGLLIWQRRTRNEHSQQGLDHQGLGDRRDIQAV